MAYGTVNADVIGTSVAGSNLGAGNASAMKNRIINGAMVIDQRNAGASVTPTTANATYCVDRYNFLVTQNSKFTAQQNAGSVTPPVGFSNYLGCTSSSAYSVVSTDYFGFKQPIEGFNTADLGWGTANAKTVTLSFQVYSSLTGTFGASVYNSAGNRIYPISYSIPVANTWTTISVTITGDTTGTWIGATNGIGLQVFFSLGAGSSNTGTAGAWGTTGFGGGTGTTSVVGTSGATFYITGVQLEVGSSATGFEYRQYQQELALCQRYYEKSYNDGTALGTATTVGVVGQSGLQGVTTTTEAGTYVTFKVTKRATPTISVWDGNGNSNKLDRLQAGVTNNYNSTFSGTSNLGANGFVGFSGSGATCTSVQFHYAASSEL